MKKFRMILSIFLFIALILIVSCNNTINNTPNEIEKPIEDEVKMKIAVIETDRGIIKAELNTEKAPITTKNFIELANSKFYDGLIFHRVEPGFVVQGGDPNGDGTGGSGKNIPLETSPELKHIEGALAMARSQDPNSASSQFYITLAPTPFLDGNYAVFGKVISGMDSVKSINVGDKMNKVYIISE